MGKLGVSQIYGFDKNLAIILLHHEKHGREITQKRVNFLIFVWREPYKTIARKLKNEYDEFLHSTDSQQKEALEQAKKLIASQFITLNVSLKRLCSLRDKN